MKRKTKIILAIMGLLLVSLACNAMVGGSSTATPSAQVLLSDDFSSSDSGWGVGTDKDSSVEYSNNALQMIIYLKNWFVWSYPGKKDYQNVHMEVTVLNNGTDSTTAFGLICNWQTPSNESFYFFVVTPAGQYAIAKASEGQSDVFLTNNDQFASSELIKKEAPSYRIGADCASNGILTLYVDGQQVASVSDVSYTSGGVAVFTWSGEEATTTNVSFDEFLLMSLP